VFTPSQVVNGSTAGAGNVILQGTVEAIEVHGPPSRFVLSDGRARVTVLFNGHLPRFFRTGWGARVQGSLRGDGEVFDASTVAALNVRDHRRYVLSAYLVVMIVLGINLVSSRRCLRQARLAITRRIRREEVPS
jgi:hypothetical protein